MSLGFKRDYEVDAVADFAQDVRIIAAAHPEDNMLQAYAKRVQLVAIMALTEQTRELKLPNANVLRDRMADCEECKRVEHCKPCNNHHDPCKYAQADYRLQSIIKHFGPEALSPLAQYIETEDTV